MPGASTCSSPHDLWENRGFDLGYVQHQLSWGKIPSRAQSFDLSVTSNESNLITASSVPANVLGQLKPAALIQYSQPSIPGQKAWFYSNDEDGSYRISKPNR